MRRRRRKLRMHRLQHVHARKWLDLIHVVLPSKVTMLALSQRMTQAHQVRRHLRLPLPLLPRRPRDGDNALRQTRFLCEPQGLRLGLRRRKRRVRRQLSVLSPNPSQRRRYAKRHRLTLTATIVSQRYSLRHVPLRQNGCRVRPSHLCAHHLPRQPQRLVRKRGARSRLF